ncbi:hypothetical protein E2C01_029670 [Portunus trituberculatus]|uniref:Uncharacterized protein n=1 Tax=Portunus trituberculatus TaxID=210409 RepID=A0A5B7ENY8_PORTR|nr:hypothetical protein [Portunus trituberculatus]
MTEVSGGCGVCCACGAHPSTLTSAGPMLPHHCPSHSNTKQAQHHSLLGSISILGQYHGSKMKINQVTPTDRQNVRGTSALGDLAEDLEK